MFFGASKTSEPPEVGGRLPAEGAAGGWGVWRIQSGGRAAGGGREPLAGLTGMPKRRGGEDWCAVNGRPLRRRLVTGRTCGARGGGGGACSPVAPHDTFVRQAILRSVAEYHRAASQIGGRQREKGRGLRGGPRGGCTSGWRGLPSRLQMPLRLSLGVRGAVAGRRLGALEEGEGGASNACDGDCAAL